MASARVLQAIDQVRLGQASIKEARAVLSSRGPTDGTLPAILDRADRQFAAADRDLHSWPVRLARWAPVAGTDVTALSDLTTTAHTAADIGVRTLDQLRPELDSHPSGGRATLQMLQQFSSASGRASAQLARLPLGPQPLLPALRRRRAQLGRDLTSVEAALVKVRSAAAAATDLLQGPHRYLILAANNAEMRDGSGMFLEAGELTTDNGTIRLAGMRPTGQLGLSYGAVMPTGDLEARWGWLEPAADWRNLGVSPRFEVTATLARQMWQRRTGHTVDGVLAVDVTTITDVLAATGPVTLSGTSLTAANATSFLMLGQYLGALGDPTHPGRADELGRLADTAVARMATGPLDAYRLAKGLQQAVAGRHLLAWAANPAIEADWQQVGAAGELSARSLALAVQNVGGNKLDQFLAVDARLQHRRAPGGTAFTLTVRLGNQSPAGLPRYVAGPGGAGGPAGQYTGLVTVSLPGDASAISVAGRREVPVAGPDGPTYVVAVPVSLRAGRAETISMAFAVPQTHGSLEVEPSARIPPVHWQTAGSSFTDTSSHEVAW